MDDSYAVRRNKKSTWKEKRIYFLKLLENVLLTGVPQIVSENNTRRKIFKTSVFFICLTGFFYHLVSFIILYLSYPTTLEVLVKFQNESTLPKPIVTICDINGIRRTSYCEDFPENCITDRDDNEIICSYYDYFCENENSTEELMFPDHETFLFSDMIRNMIEKYGSRAEDILELYKNETTHIIFANEFGKLRNCYSIDFMKFNSKALEIFIHRFFDMHMLDGISIGHLMLEFQPEESFLPFVPVGAKVSIHSHDQLVNPFIDGFVIKPGMRYIIQLKAIEENLLASPYATNCTNYSNLEEGESHNESDNRERCLVECKKEIWIKQCNCVSGQYAFHFDGKFCSNKTEINCILNADVHECYLKCTVSCKSIFFEYEVDEVPLENTELLRMFLDPSLLYDTKRLYKEKVWISSLNFFFKRPELLIYKYKPQFELIELFSYIGGYIGIWLGISLIAVCDFLEMLFTYFYHVLKGKVPVNRETKSNSLLEVKSNV